MRLYRYLTGGYDSFQSERSVTEKEQAQFNKPMNKNYQKNNNNNNNKGNNNRQYYKKNG